MIFKTHGAGKTGAIWGTFHTWGTCPGTCPHRRSHGDDPSVVPLHPSPCYARSPRVCRALTLALVDGRPTLPDAAMLLRVGVTGDPSGETLEDQQRLATTILNLRARGGRAWGYTHDPARAEALRPFILASCATLADVDAALDRGWGASLVAPQDQEGDILTPKGRRIRQCPATTARGKAMGLTCHDCNLCSRCSHGRGAVYFPDHGSGRPERVAARADKVREYMTGQGVYPW